MERQNQSNVRGGHTPSRQRPALLPRPNQAAVDPSVFALPPPNMRMNNYPTINSDFNQPSLPNFNTPMLPIDPNSRSSSVQQLPGMFYYYDV